MDLENRYSLWKKEIKTHRILILISMLLLIFSIIINYYSGNYTDRVASDDVTDLILDFIPPLNLSLIFVWGYMSIILIGIIYPLFFNVKKLHVILGQYSLLMMVRNLFICLTHLKLPAGAIDINWPGVFSNFGFQNDLFFSGHVATPFLGFLVFRKEKIGYVFLALTSLMVFTVLATHRHYSIDVFAAFFITYGTYKFGNRFFKCFNNKE